MARRRQSKDGAASQPAVQPDHEFQRLIDLCPHEMFAVDRALRFTAFNQTFARRMQERYGARIEKGGCLLEYVTAPEDREAAQCNLERAFGGETLRTRHLLGAQESSRQLFEITHSPVRGADGVVTGVQVYAENIHELHQARTQLQSSEELFETAFTQGMVGAAQLSPEGRFLRVNPALCAVLGYSEAELVERSFSDITPEEDRELSLAFWRDVQTGLTDTVRFEKRCIRKDGTVLWADVSSRACRDAAGNLKYFISHYIEITRVKRAQAELLSHQIHLDQLVREQTQQILASEARYRGLFETTGAMILMLELHTGVILDANPAACAFFERPHDLMLRARRSELFDMPPLEAQAYTQKIMAGEKPYFEAVYRRLDGEVYSLGIYPELIHHGGGQAALAVVHDITARKLVERSLMESEKRFHSVMEQMQEGVVLIGFDWCYLYINRAAEGQGRRPKEELLGRTVQECWPESVGNWLYELEERVMRERISGRKEHELHFGKGDVRWFEWRIQPAEEGILVITVDITEAKQAEHKLKDSEQSLRKTIDTIPGLIWSLLPDGAIDYLNQGWLDFTGLTHTQAVGSGWMQALHPDDLNETVTKWAEATSTGSLFEVEHRLRRYDGEYHWFLTRALPVLSGPGGVVKWYGMNTDILDRRRAEDAFRRSHQQLEELAAQVPGMLYQLVRSSDGTFSLRYSSGGLREAVAGVEAAASGGFALLARLTTAEDAERVADLVRESARTMEPFAAELRLRDPTGAEGGEPDRWIWASALPDGGIQWSGIATDITERKRLEQSLAESEQRFHTVMEHMQEGVVLIGFDWRYLYINPTAEIQGNRKKADLLGRTVMACWPGIETDPYFLLEQQVMRERTAATVEGLFGFADGSDHWLQWRIQPTEEGLLVIKVDITERKLQEAATADSEDRFRLLFNTAIDGIIFTTPGKFVEMANPAASAMLGWTEEEIVKGHLPQVIDPIDERLQNLLTERARSGVCKGEVTLRRKDGTKFEAEMASTLFTDRQGVTRASMFFRDISERLRAEAGRLRAEEERRRSHAQLESLAAQVPGGLYQFVRGLDGTYTILYCSTGVWKMFGIYEDSSAVDLAILSDRIAPNDMERMAAALEESTRNMGPFEFEFRVQGLDGQAEGAPERWMWASALPDGCILWSGYTTEISERKRLESQVRRSEVKWRSLFELLPVGVSVVDAEHRMTDSNPALAQILGMTEAGLLAGIYSHRKYFRPDMTEMPAQEFASNRALREQAAVRNVETGVLKEDGTIVWTSISATPLYGGKGTATVTVDITGRKEEQQRTEEALVFSQTIIETSPIGILIYNDAGDCLAANRASGEMIGVSQAGLLKQNYRSLESWKAGGLYDAAIEALRTRLPVTIQAHFTSTFGKELWLNCTFKSFLNCGKTHLLVMFVDDSERNRAELSLKVTNEKLLAMVADLARSNRNADLLRQMSEMLQVCAGMEEAYAVIEQFAPQIFVDSPGALYTPTKGPELLGAVCVWGANLVSELQFPADQCWALRRGQIFAVNAAARGVKCRHVSPDFQGCYLDIPLIASGETLGLLHLEWARAEEPERTARELAQLLADNISLSFSNIRLRETLHDQSVRDPLTRAFNRRYMEESLERELARVRRKNGHVGLIMLDIDHFKSYNDTYGHAAGDLVLKRLTELLHSHVRGEDVVCRMGGEEFLMILPETDGAVTLERAEAIRATVEEMNRDKDSKLVGVITISLGVAVFPEHGLSREELLEKVDQAMYRAKGKGRNRVECSRSLV